MKFTFEEAELLNNICKGKTTNLTKEKLISELELLILNTKELENEKDLIDIAQNTLNKIISINVETFNKIFSNFPVDIVHF